jgi:hypothetical protein
MTRRAPRFRFGLQTGSAAKAGLVCAMVLTGAVAGWSATDNASASATKTASLAKASRPANAIALFNGRDLGGWTIFVRTPVPDPKTLWSVADGVLHLVGQPNGYIRTEKTFSNYHLHVEWRWPADGSTKSNSGVFVHVRGPDAIWPAGIECQLASGNAGQLIGTDVTLPGAPIINKKPRATRLATSSEKSLGEWNAYDIVCRGDTLDVLVNGVRQNHADKISVTSGAICLQMEGYPVEFRNVWLEPVTR